MTKLKFSKKYDLFDIKKDFFLNNLKNLKKIKKINKYYSNQKKRIFCKICNFKLKDFFLENFSIKYCLCKKCGHLNGRYQDTDNFIKWLYTRADGKNYKSSYVGNYKQRVKKIYLPKANFLKSVIKSKISVLDFGSGAGHFLKALEKLNIKSKGLEPNKILVNLGNSQLKNKNLYHFNINNDFFNEGDTKNYNVLSLIHVLEHMQNPHQLLKSFKRSSINYLYLAIPLASFSMFIENAFTNVFPRHLAAGHTHLFTRKSLDYILKKYNLKIIGEWWFGSDISDLLRSISLSSKKINKTEYKKYFQHYILNLADELQSTLDKNKLCSEVHLVLKKSKQK